MNANLPRLIFVHESAPDGASPGAALHKGRVHRVILGITYIDYMRYERPRLLPSANRWRPSKARKAAAFLLGARPEGVFVLLGSNVARAFDVGRLLEVVRRGARTFVALPYPGVRNAMWDADGVCVARCRKVLLEAAPGLVLGGA